MENEIWKDIVGFEGYYMVSSFGSVKSFDRRIQHNYGGKATRLGRLLKLGVSHGYNYAYLSVNKTVKAFRVHRLVAEAFIPNPENRPQVNHKNGIKIDNKIENLEWSTSSENLQHAHSTGLKLGTKGKVGKDNIKSIPIKQLDPKDGKVIKVWDSIGVASRETGYEISNLIKCCKGRGKTAYGFRWSNL